MPEYAGSFYRFIVLVPHANARAEFNKYRRTLFASGCRAAYSLPAAAPIALVKEPAPKDELGRIAHLLRQGSRERSDSGKIRTDAVSSVHLPDGKIIAGPRLSIIPPPLPENIALIATFPELILGVGLFSETPRLPEIKPLIEFRAAAVANMILRPLDYADSYSWTIGEPRWLPRTA
jgi:hypothetical protein